MERRSVKSGIGTPIGVAAVITFGAFASLGCGGHETHAPPIDLGPRGNGGAAGAAGHAGKGNTGGAISTPPPDTDPGDMGSSGGRLSFGGRSSSGAKPSSGGVSPVDDGGVVDDGSSGTDPYDSGAMLETQAVAYQIDPAHSGAQPRDVLRLPLKQRWSHDFTKGDVSYALASQGRVFVTVVTDDISVGGLYALSAATGSVVWGPADVGGAGFANAALEDGRVFTVNGNGLMKAFDTATGKQVWSTQMNGQYSFSAAPTAIGGRVFVGGAGSGGTLYAVDAKSGVIEWTAPVENGDDSSPAVSRSAVYVSYACNQAYGFRVDTGVALWHYSGDCEGGGGATVALIGDGVYTRDFEGNLILDAAGGKLVDTYTTSQIPAGWNDVLYTVQGGSLVARMRGAGSPNWTFSDGAVSTPPIVVGKYVVVGSSTGALNVVSVSDGQVASTDMLAVPANPDNYVFQSLSAAGNQLYVPLGAILTAY